MATTRLQLYAVRWGNRFRRSLIMFDPENHHRRSVRLRGYDYAQPGEYFVTLCTHGMRTLFGRVIDGRMELNTHGGITDEEWRQSEALRPEIELDDWVVMHNHLHGIVRIRPVRAHGRAPVIGHSLRIPRRQPRSLASFVGGFKSAVKHRINELRHTPGAVVWQRNYYEHIIRSPHELEIIREYIRHNPLRWTCDRHNPERGLLVQDAEGSLESWMG